MSDRLRLHEKSVYRCSLLSPTNETLHVMVLSYSQRGAEEIARSKYPDHTFLCSTFCFSMRPEAST